MTNTLPYFERLRLIKQGLLPKESVAKPKKAIAKVSKKRKFENEKSKQNEGDSEINRWFIERRKEMTGKCCYCGGKTEKNNNSTFKNSIAHIFAKRKNMFPTIATHQLNFIELCFYGKSCHSNLDNNILTFDELMNSTAKYELQNKIDVLYAAMTNEEKSKVPDNILKYINEN
jgi:hypothetical protein